MNEAAESARRDNSKSLVATQQAVEVCRGCQLGLEIAGIDSYRHVGLYDTSRARCIRSSSSNRPRNAKGIASSSGLLLLLMQASGSRCLVVSFRAAARRISQNHADRCRRSIHAHAAPALRAPSRRFLGTLSAVALATVRLKSALQSSPES